MYCTRCGTSAINKRFCTKCGFELKKSAPQADSAESILSKKTLEEVLQDQPVDFLVGRTIDHRYFLESRIGGGGMGNVYPAKRLNIGDMAADKILKPERSADSRTVERFRREAKVGASLSHPNALMDNAIDDYQTIVIDQNAIVEQSPEMSSIEEPRTTRKVNAIVLLTVSLILLLTVAAGYTNLRNINHDRNIEQSTAPVVIKNVEPTPEPQLETDLPTNPTPATNPTPDAPAEKPTPNIETKPSLPGGNQPVRKQARETRKPVAATRKAAPPKAVIPDIEDYRLNRDRRMMFDDYGRYRRYRYNSYWPDYRDRFYTRRRSRWNYR
jgi:hypothetical protein